MRDTITIWTEGEGKGGGYPGLQRVSRCLDIASALRDMDLPVSLLVNGERGAVDRVEERGFRYSVASFDSPGVSRAAGGVVVMDTGRDVTDKVKTLKKRGRKVILIDNRTQASRHADQEIVPSAFFSNDSGAGNLYGGSEYIIIGENFLDVRERKRRIPYSLPLKVLVVMCGPDPEGIALKSVRALRGVRDIEINAIVGPDAAQAGMLEELESEQANLKLLFGVKDLAPLMSISHIAVTVLCPTLFELAYMGVPSIILIERREDERHIRAIKGFNIGIPVGYHGSVGEDRIREAVEFFIKKPLAWEAISEMACELTDGQGAWRIAHIIESLLDELNSEKSAFEANSNGVCHA